MNGEDNRVGTEGAKNTEENNATLNSANPADEVENKETNGGQMCTDDTTVTTMPNDEVKNIGTEETSSNTEEITHVEKSIESTANAALTLENVESRVSPTVQEASTVSENSEEKNRVEKEEQSIVTPTENIPTVPAVPEEKLTISTERKCMVTGKHEQEETTPVTSPSQIEQSHDALTEQTETPKLGLLERPVEIETGKRSRKKTERLSEKISNIVATPAEKKLSIPEGAGVKLGDCPAIEEAINKTKADSLKPFHRLLYGVMGKTFEVKRNIRQFCGWSFTEESNEYKKKMAAANKLSLPVLKTFCKLLKLETSGTKDTLVQSIMGFLLNPTAEGKEIRKKPEKSLGEKKKRGRPKKAESVEGEGSDKEGGHAATLAESATSDAEPSPPQKKRKTATKKTTTESKKTSTKGSSGKKRKKVASDESDNSSDEEPLSKKINPRPTNSKIKKVVQKILNGANLEVVTMKSVRQSVFDKYPDHDLSDKREFIKQTVKEILGA